MHFNGPQTKFIRDSLYKHPVHVASDILYEVMQATMTMKTIFDGVTSFVI